MADAPTTEEVRALDVLDALRADGWAVAVHNDYRLNGKPHTFWLFTKGERAVKGEGETDAQALGQIAQRLARADTAEAELARLRPLAELGGLALAWGRALRECAAARDAVKHATDLPAMLSAQHRAIDDAWDARAKLATAAMRMAEKEVGRG